MTLKIGFVGAGQMARALAVGFVQAGLVRGEQIGVADVAAQALADFAAVVPGAVARPANADLVRECETVFIAVKPQHLDDAMLGMRSTGGSSSSRLFVSIVAGASLERLSAGLNSQRVIRVMPNTPCLIGLGASAYCLGNAATTEDGAWVERLLSAVGTAFVLKESLLNAVTGLSGSGPAYVYQFIEALADGGVRMGLPRDVAQKLAAQTVLGSAAMVLRSNEHPAVLKDRVASPGGTTIAGLEALEQAGMRAAVIGAVRAATERAQQLGS